MKPIVYHAAVFCNAFLKNYVVFCENWPDFDTGGRVNIKCRAACSRMDMKALFPGPRKQKRRARRLTRSPQGREYDLISAVLPAAAGGSRKTWRILPPHVSFRSNIIGNTARPTQTGAGAYSPGCSLPRIRPGARCGPSCRTPGRRGRECPRWPAPSRWG